MRWARLAVATTLASANVACTAEDVRPASAGEVLALSCSSCHAADADPESGIPHLGRLSAEQLAAAMTGFKDGTRPATLMDRIAPGYTDEEIQWLAEHLAGP